MSATYALLVGIDNYLPSVPSVPSLHGCVEDVKAIDAVLSRRISRGHLDVRVLTNEEATRSAVIDGFRTHLSKALAGDVVIFWYSGHGSQQQTASAVGVEPDGLDETLVLVDSRTEDGFDLLDKELAALLAEVARPGVHVFVGLDCCHSGSGTREILPTGTLIRQVAINRRVRPIGSYLPAPATPARHVLLAACRPDQTAKEVAIAGEPRGALSIAVERALGDASAEMTYRELHRTVRAAVGQLAVDQVPQLEVTVDEDTLGGVFSGNLTPRQIGYLVTFTKGDWVLDAGAVHGIPVPHGGETTQLQLLDPDTGSVLTTAHVDSVRPDSSIIKLETDLEPTRTYQAVVTAWPLPKVAVSVDERLKTIAAEIDASPYLMRADSADLRVSATDGAIDIIDTTRRAEPVTRLPAGSTDVVASLEQIVRWRQIIALNNAGSGLTGVQLELHSSDGETLTGDEIVLSYQETGPSSFTVAVRNTGPTTVYCAVLALSESYAVLATILPGNSARLLSGEVATSNVIKASVPDSLWQAGVTRRTDVLKLIVAGAEFDPEVLAQKGLRDPVLSAGTRGEKEVAPAPPNTLARLLRRVQQRELELVPGLEPTTDWTTSSVRVISERPLPGVPVGPSVELTPGVILEAPAGLTASALLTTGEAVARDLSATVPVAPPMMTDDPASWAPWALVSTRDGAPLVDALELRDVSGLDAVTPETPMLLRLNEIAAPEESVLVIGFDGLNYYVVGHIVRDGAPGTTIRVDCLPPAPPAITTKSLTSSVRLMFRRFLHKVTGKPAYETRLAVATFDPPDRVHYDDDPVRVAEAVAAADRLVLLIHGILGDTEGMVRGGAGGFGAEYDLLLTFDYENINTPVNETAAELKRKLTAAGLGTKPAQQFDIVAHSMGGLVARWLIEQQGGGSLVSRLITAGAPNGGSPWPVLHDWATIALTFGLNQLAHAFWPARILSGLISLIERIDTTLDDMEPGSDRLQTLFTSADPHRPYTVLVGNRALVVVHPESNGRVASILTVLKRKSLDVATGLAFLNTPNDLAVAVASAEHLPAPRSPAPQIEQVACDHLTFFSSDAGQAALTAAVLPGATRT